MKRQHISFIVAAVATFSALAASEDIWPPKPDSIRTKVNSSGELVDDYFDTFEDAFLNTADKVVVYVGKTYCNVATLTVPDAMTLTGDEGCGEIIVSECLTIGKDAVVDVPSVVNPWKEIDNQGTFVINKLPNWLNLIGIHGRYETKAEYTPPNTSLKIPAGSIIVGVADPTSPNGILTTLTLPQDSTMTSSYLSLRGLSLAIEGNVKFTEDLWLSENSSLTISGTLICSTFHIGKNCTLTIDGQLPEYQTISKSTSIEDTGILRTKYELGSVWKSALLSGTDGIILKGSHSEEDGFYSYTPFHMPVKARDPFSGSVHLYYSITEALKNGKTDVELFEDCTLTTGWTFKEVLDYSGGGLGISCNRIWGDEDITLTLEEPIVIENTNYQRFIFTDLSVVASKDFEGETMITAGGAMEDWTATFSSSNAPAVKTVLAVSGHNTKISEWYNTIHETYPLKVFARADQMAIDIVSSSAHLELCQGSKVTGIIGYHAGGELRITGGEFDVTWDIDPSIPEKSRKITITGGAFTQKVPDELLPDGLVSELSDDGRYLVKNPSYPYLNETRNVSQANLKAVLEDSGNGDAIRMTRDAVSDTDVTESYSKRNIVVNFDGHTQSYYGKGNRSIGGLKPSLYLNGSGSVVFSNGTLSATAMSVNNGKTLLSPEVLLGIKGGDIVLHDMTIDAHDCDSLKACLLVEFGIYSPRILRLRGRTKIIAPAGVDAITFSSSDNGAFECDTTCRFSSRIPTSRCPAGYVPCRYADCPEAPFGIRVATDDDLSGDLLPAIDPQEENAVARIADILSIAADERLGLRIVTPQDYGDFRGWVLECGFDVRQVMDSPAAYTAWHLGLGAVPDGEPVIRLEDFAPSADGTGARLKLRVQYGHDTLTAEAAKVRPLMRYATELNPRKTEWLPFDDADCIAKPNDDGTVGFTLHLPEAKDSAFFKLHEFD